MTKEEVWIRAYAASVAAGKAYLADLRADEAVVAFEKRRKAGKFEE